MGLEEVKKEILDKGEREAESIIAEANAEAEKMLGDAEKKIDDYKISRAEQSKKLIEILEKREITQAEFEVRKKSLDKKKEIIERSFDLAKEKISKFPDNKRIGLLKKLLAKAKKDIEVGVIYANSRDKNLLRRIVPGKIMLKDKQMAGGFIAETEDGTVSVDYSFEEILGSIKEKNLQEISALLFKN